MRVLIVRIGAMGDVLHAMPAVAALKARHPECFVGWAIDPRWADLLQIAGDPYDLAQAAGPTKGRALVDRWYRVATREWRQRPFSRQTALDLAGLRGAMRAESFDLCVDLQGSLKSAVVGRMAGARLFAGPARPREELAARLYRRRLQAAGDHVVEQACAMLGQAVGDALDPVKVQLPLDERSERWADEVVGEERFALLSGGGGWGAKIWPPERYGSLAQELRRRGVAVVVNDAPGGAPEASAILRASAGCARGVASTVAQLIALVRRAAVVVGGDTGPIHLAAALERPLVAIFGPTDPRRNGPWRNAGSAAGQIVLRDERSLTTHKRLLEPEAGLLRIAVEDVLRAVEAVSA